MKKYILYKDNKHRKILGINLSNGYSFFRDNKIVIYDNFLIKSLILYKLNNKLKRILKQYLENEEDTGSSDELKLSIDELRLLLSDTYVRYLDKKTYLEYLNKLNKIEQKFVKNTKKRRIR